MAEKNSINELKSLIARKNGLAKPTRFLVEFSLPSSVASASEASDLSIMCQSASLPTRDISTVDYAGTQRQSFKIPSGYTNSTVTCTFLVGNDFFPKNIFDKWMGLSVDPVSYRVKYIADYSSNVNIYQLDEFGNRIYGVQLQEAFPTSVSPIDLNASSTDQVHNISVTFSYYDVLFLSGAGPQFMGPDDNADKTA